MQVDFVLYVMVIILVTVVVVVVTVVFSCNKRCIVVLKVVVVPVFVVLDTWDVSIDCNSSDSILVVR